ncbi:MAG TPA: hypothetical protein VEG84_02790 [Thermoanaerobaculia bacterium]|nr:hypothetical protein [Thermoanaerobaculia bacterium]
MISASQPLRLQLLGVCLEISTDISDFADALSGRLPPFESPCRSQPADRRYGLERAEESGEGLTLSRGLRKPVLVAGREAAADLLAEDAERFLAHHAADRIFVHAGAVGWRGKAILLPGRSGAGKTELVAALLRSGAEYFSDEFGLLDAHGNVHPYARPLALRREGGQVARLAPEAFGSRRAAAMPLGAIAFLRYRARGAWKGAKISAGESLLGLLANTVAVRKRFGEAKSVLASLAATTFAFRGTRGEAAEAARLLLAEVDRRIRR